MSTKLYTFRGWLSHDKSSVDGKMTWGTYEPKPSEETYIDIRITHCGACGSDLHVLRSSWGETPYPITVGHEIVGVAVRMGSAAEGDIQVGDRVGVGAQSDSCQTCDDCADGAPNLGICSYLRTGGYAKYSRVPSRFIIKISDGLDSAHAAPMMCGGLAGMKVGMVGVGGLGHFAVLFAKAMGADLIAAENYKSLHLIISTVSSSQALMTNYMTLLKREGTICKLGNPDNGDFKISAFMVMQRVKFPGSLIGSPTKIRQMLQFAVDKKIKPWIQERPMSEANKAIVDLQDGKPRYRYVLVNQWD
ncbi:zinc-binding dehydrogenase [Ilyonectria destructans]|nr:zinc-binding dehydrogenase [Ilyonectria destructans]